MVAGKRSGAVSNVVRLFVHQIRDQLFSISLCVQPVPHASDFRIVLFAEPIKIDLLHTLLSLLADGAGLPEGGEHGMQIVVQISFAQRCPLVAVEPDAFATVTMIDREIQSSSDQVPNHAEPTLRAINGNTRFRKRQAFRFMNAFGEIRALVLDPVPIFFAANPVAFAFRTIEGGQVRLQLGSGEFRRFADWTIELFV